DPGSWSGHCLSRQAQSCRRRTCSHRSWRSHGAAIRARLSQGRVRRSVTAAQKVVVVKSPATTHLVLSLLEAQGDETGAAIRLQNQEHCCFLAVLFELVDALLKLRGVGDWLLLNFGDDHARRESFFGCGRIRIHTSDEDSLHLVLNVVFLAQF